MSRPEDRENRSTIGATFVEPGLAEYVAARGKVLSIVTREFLDG